MFKRVFTLTLACIVLFTYSVSAVYEEYTEPNVDGGTIIGDDSGDDVTFIVELEGGGVLEREKAEGGFTLNAAVKRNILNGVKRYQDNALKSVSAITKTTVNAKYSHIINGFSINGKADLKEELERIDNVKNVYISRERFKICSIDGNEANQLMAAVDHTAQDNMIGLDETVRSEYTGKGMVVGIIDSELQYTHDAFKNEPPVENRTLTKEKIESALAGNEFSAETVFTGALSANDTYKSGKIPFTFDYAGKDTDPSTTYTESYHGTHVAGIAAGNCDDFKGVAGDAQLVFMKVAADGKESFSDDVVLSALDDLVKLKVDIINMSFGVESGFPDEMEYSEIFRIIKDEGIVIASSVGNSGRFGENRSTKAPMAKYPDYGLVCSPSAFEYSTSVASISLPTDGAAEAKMSSFSSWGTTPDMKLKPEITTVGGRVVSAAYNNNYKMMSGTSMAAPQYAGAAAVLLERVNKINSSLSKLTKQKYAQQMLASTAVIEYDGGVPVSPRKQGAGVVNISKAVNTPAVLYNSDGVKTKVELGEIGQSFNVKFMVQNITSTAVKYSLSGFVIADKSEKNSDGVDLVSGTQLLDGSVVSFENNEISIPANQVVEVSASVALDSAELAELESSFTNGFFVEGFIILSEAEKTDGSVLSIPFMGFYGDWSAIPVYNGTVNDKKDGYETSTGLYGEAEDGINSLLFGASSKNTYFSPNVNQKIFFFSDNLRNISKLNLVVADENGNKLLNKSYNNVYKNTRIEINGKAAFHSGNIFYLFGDDSGIETPPDGYYTVNVSATAACPDAEVENLQLKLCVDSVFPELVDGVYYTDDSGKTWLYVLATDDKTAPIVYLTDGKGGEIYSDMRNEDGYIVFDITACDPASYSIVIFDASKNIVSYKIERANGYVGKYKSNVLNRAISFSALSAGGILLNKQSREILEGETERVFVWDDNLVPLTK